MPALIAFLRGINVGGKCILPMADLKKLFLALRLENPRTLLQSGNVIFDLPEKQNLTTLSQTLEAAVLERFHIPAAVILRTSADFQKILAHNPFPAFAAAEPSHLLVMFFKRPPDPQNLRRLPSLIVGREQFQARGTELYLTYPDSIGTSKLTSTLIEKTLHLPATARNWNTLQKLAALLAQSSPSPRPQ